MKIEKVNDNQIRCTLTKEDLINRELKLSELAYGTEKAKSLFRDMMQQAAYEFGFEANDIPLMIEAIPLSSESILLIITKVEDPEELDTRFAKFTPSSEHSEGSQPLPIPAKLEGADDILGLFQKIQESRRQAAAEKPAKGSEAPQEETPCSITRLYSFADLDTVIRAAHILDKFYAGENTLYRNPVSREYQLLVCNSNHTPAEFNKVCNILSEYGSNTKFVPTMAAYCSEHMECVIEKNAIQRLAALA